MKFGIRMPSLKKRISARTSLKRVLRHRVGLKAPSGMGILTNPKKSVYNKIYNKTSVSVDDLLKIKSPTKHTNPNSVDRNSIWNAGNFKSREELLSKSKENNITTNGKFICEKCGSDIWSIANVGLFFIRGDAVFCQTCGRSGVNISEFKR